MPRVIWWSIAILLPLVVQYLCDRLRSKIEQQELEEREQRCRRKKNH